MCLSQPSSETVSLLGGGGRGRQPGTKPQLSCRDRRLKSEHRSDLESRMWK